MARDWVEVPRTCCKCKGGFLGDIGKPEEGGVEHGA